MAQKEFTIEVGKDRFAKDARIVHQPYGMDIYLDADESEDLIALVTPEEIAEEATLGELLVALVAKHGLNQLLYELMDNSETTAILDIVYDADDDTTRTWAIDKFASESE